MPLINPEKNYLKGLVIVLGLLVVSCSERPKIGELQNVNGRTMGTSYSVTYRHVVSLPSSQLLKKEIDERLVRFNNELSTYIETSDISRFNKLKADTAFELGEDFKTAYLNAVDVNRSSDGAFDATVMPLVNLWGFGPDGPQKVPNETLIDKTRQKVGMDKLVYDAEQGRLLKKRDGVELDFSASAKGLGVDRVAELLESYEVKDYLIEIGGEMRVSGDKGENGPWVVAIESPSSSDANTRSAQKILTLKKPYALATSGSYRNFFEQKGKMYQHTLNPKTGRPVESQLISASVLDLNQSCMQADAWATAFMVMGAEKAKKISIELNLATYFIIQVGKEKRRFIGFESPRFKELMNRQTPLEGR